MKKAMSCTKEVLVISNFGEQHDTNFKNYCTKDFERETAWDTQWPEWNKIKGTARWEEIALLLYSPLLARPKLTHFKSSCFNLEAALAQNVNIII